MQSFQSYPTSGSMQRIYSQGQPPTIKHYSPLSSLPMPMPRKETKLHAAQKHRLAEQNRRNRISGQYATLRAILPSLSKTDKNKLKKAFVLAETIRRVRELKKLVLEKRAANREVRGECGIPSGADRLSLEPCGGGGEGMMKAVMSCEDRREIMAELAKALKTVKVKVVRAEMVTVGGRNKFALWIQGPKEGLGVLKRVLEAVMRRPSWIARKPRSDWHIRAPTANNFNRMMTS